MTDFRSALVTGGNGFIGRHLVRRLASSGHRRIDFAAFFGLRGSAKELLRVDPLSPDTISAVLAGRRFDWVFHLASYRVRSQDRDIEPMFRVNVDATRKLLLGPRVRWYSSAQVRNAPPMGQTSHSRKINRWRAKHRIDCYRRSSTA